MNAELLQVTNWFAQNKLSLNISKTNYVLFKNIKKTITPPDLLLNNIKVKRVFTTKFLGVEIDHKLNWSYHIKSIENKLSSANFILRKIKHKLNTDTALKLYDTLILTHLSYCNIIWGNTYKKYLQNVIRLQKRALRLCNLDKNPENNSKSSKLFLNSNRLKFHLNP